MSDYHLTRTAVFVFLERDKEYFYLRRQNTGWNDGRLTVPSGHVDQGETIKQAAVREAQEEAGIVINEADLEFVQVQSLVDRYTYYYFKTSVWTGEPGVNEPDLASECLWADMNHLPEDVIPYLKTAFNGLNNQIYFAEVEPDRGD